MDNRCYSYRGHVVEVSNDKKTIMLRDENGEDHSLNLKKAFEERLGYSGEFTIYSLFKGGKMVEFVSSYTICEGLKELAEDEAIGTLQSQPKTVVETTVEETPIVPKKEPEKVSKESPKVNAEGLCSVNLAELFGINVQTERSRENYDSLRNLFKNKSLADEMINLLKTDDVTADNAIKSAVASLSLSAPSDNTDKLLVISIVNEITKSGKGIEVNIAKAVAEMQEKVNKLRSKGV